MQEFPSERRSSLLVRVEGNFQAHARSRDVFAR